MEEGLKKLQCELENELEMLQHPPSPWLLGAKEGVLDVAIIGGGMAGLTAAFALIREGISNIRIFDASIQGYEGPWANYARMRILRSQKNLAGPALEIPKLTFQAWYEAQYGKKEWERLYKIHTPMWMEYLRWYRSVLSLPVTNDTTVTRILKVDNLIQLTFQNGDRKLARKVILATGRDGFGGPNIPSFVDELPKDFYAHTCDPIDFLALEGKRVAVAGCGASAFDAAACALEAKAASVDMLVRRQEIPSINKFATLYFSGFTQGYFLLDDAVKIKIMQYVLELGSPPPFESIDRVRIFPNFHLLKKCSIEKASLEDGKIALKTSCGLNKYDFLILGTGFALNGKRRTELSAIYDDILLWKDVHPDLPHEIGEAPYLGPNFEFKSKNSAFLHNIYCFNQSALLTHGLTAGDIPEISAGAARLAKGIAADFFIEEWQLYFQKLKEFGESDSQ